MPLIQRAALTALDERAHRQVDEGALPSCSYALALDGEVVHAAAHGEATPDTRYAIFSCTKPIVAAAIWHLLADGRLALAQKVAEVFPEFADDPTHLRMFGAADVRRLLAPFAEVEVRHVAGRLVPLSPRLFANDIAFRAQSAVR